MNQDETMQDIHRKIDRERALINAANAMRAQTDNEAVRSRLDSQIRDGRRNMQFFEERLRELQLRKLNQGVNQLGIRDSSGGPPPPPPKDSNVQFSQIGQHGDMMPAHHPFPPPAPGSHLPRGRPNFTKLGTDIPIKSCTGVFASVSTANIIHRPYQI